MCSCLERSRNVRARNKSYDSVAELKCLEATVGNQKCCLWWNREHTEFANYLLTFLCCIFWSPVRRLQIKIGEVYYNLLLFLY